MSTEYTVEVNTLYRIDTSHGSDWDIRGTSTLITTENYRDARLVFTCACSDQNIYSNRLAYNERVAVSLVAWPETGFGETLDYAEYNHDGLVY